MGQSFAGAFAAIERHRPALLVSCAGRGEGKVRAWLCVAAIRSVFPGRVRCDREASLNIQQSRRAGGAREKESCVLFVMCVRFVRNHGRLVKGGRNLAKDPVPVTLSQRRNALRQCGLNVPSSLDIPQACFFWFDRTLRFRCQRPP